MQEPAHWEGTRMAELNEGNTHYYSAFVLNGERFTIGACIFFCPTIERDIQPRRTRVRGLPWS
jgi:hypothetical protein